MVIYSLSDPITGEVRYVGATKNLKNRMVEHLRGRSRWDSGIWIRSLKEKGLEPQPKILETVNQSQWQDKEREWISKFKLDGANLTNTLPGGKGGVTESMAKHISEALKGRPKSEAHRRALSKSVKRTWKNPDMAEKMISAIRISKNKESYKAKRREQWENSPERRERAKSRMKDMWTDPKYRKKVISAITKNHGMRGKHYSPEQREIIVAKRMASRERNKLQGIKQDAVIS